MKSINLFVAAAAIALTTTSCVESSSKYKAVVADRDSLLVIGDQYLSTMDILNDVENGFRSIRERESSIVLELTDREGQQKNKKELISAQLGHINDILETNKTRIAELEAKIAKDGKTNNSLRATIKRLQGELDERTKLVETLQLQLEGKDVEIAQLAQVVRGLKSDVAKGDSINSLQKTVISVQDKEINRRWYCVGEKSELKEKNVISGSGIFNAKTKMNKEFDESAFEEVDLRRFSEINTLSKSPKLLSSHPEGSYELVKDENKIVTLKITDASRFWNNAMYLVIQK